MKKNEMGGTCGTYGGEERCIHGLVGKPDGKRLLGRPRHIYGGIILKWVFKKGDGACTGLIWLKIGAGFCESHNEPSGSVQCGKLLG